ncbi:O-antigen ligase [Bosea lathyri]|uniref:O-antigen ligase n=2 Tax=Bosea lathyri TaxID=1036778 RepID=A0A1H6BH75_9HYPH|nr:O-antigen ligase [Bosea lathyri]
MAMTSTHAVGTDGARTHGAGRATGVRDAGPVETFALSAVFVAIIFIYAALGRDVFSNSLVQGQNDDLISALLPFLRVAICAAGVVIVMARAGMDWIFARIPWLFLPFVLVASASVVWSVDAKTTLRNAAGLAALWIALPIVVNRIGLRRAVAIIVHVVALVLIVSLMLALFVPDIGRHTGMEIMQQSHAGRWRGMLGHKNSLGAWAALGSVFLFTHTRQLGGPKLYWWLARAAALSCLVGAESATGIVVMCVLWMIWLGLQILRRAPLMLAIAINIVLAAVMTVGGFALNDLLFDVLGRNAGLTGRPIIWAIAEHFYWMRPWLGSGLGTLGGPEFLEYILNSIGQAIPGPENGYFVLLLETGIIGTACFLLAILAALMAGFGWLRYVDADDRSAIEFMLMILLAALVTGIAESRAFIYYGTDTIVTYCALLSLLALPKAPRAVQRAQMRLASSFLPPTPVDVPGRGTFK